MLNFESLGLKHSILKALQEMGYTTPTPIQEQAIPAALAGRDVLGCARTGTGKTCAFSAPILQRLSAKPVRGRPIRALILTPTRELAIQIHENLVAYGKNLPLKSVVIFGGVGQAPQVEAIRSGCDILVATPGRLLDLHNQGLVDVSHLEIFVLDEADRMLDMGFIHDVKKILTWLPQKKQTLFFSATMPDEITDLVNSLLHDPVKIAVDPVSSPVEVISQSVYLVDRANKTKLLIQLLNAHSVPSALVFTRTKHGANKVAQDLEKAGVTAAAIHGNKSQTARQNALAGFKDGSIRVLVATDIAARGLDIEDLSCVFNFNLPEVPETYVHRIGRTGRAGKDGIAITLCEFSEKPLLRDIEKLIKRQIPVVDDHPFPMENFSVPVKDSRGRIVNQDDLDARAAARKASQARRQAAAEAAEQKKAEAVRTTSEAEPAPAAGKRSGKKRKQTAPESVLTPVAVPAETPAAKKTGRKKKPAASAAVAAPVAAEPAGEPAKTKKTEAPGKSKLRKPEKKGPAAKPAPAEEEVSFSAIKLPESRKYKRPERKPMSALDDIAPAMPAAETPVSAYGVKRTGRLRNTFLSPEEQARYSGKSEPVMDATSRLFSTRREVPQRFQDDSYRAAKEAERAAAEAAAREEAEKKQAAAKASKKPAGRKTKPVEKKLSAKSKPAGKTEPPASEPVPAKKKSAKRTAKVAVPVTEPVKQATEAGSPAAKKATGRKTAKTNKAAAAHKQAPGKTVAPAEKKDTAPSGRLLTPVKSKRKKSSNHPPRDQRSIYGAHKSDSTETKGSLMKPYYLSDD